jgi:formylmethanofuran dehydrogenase subunit E
MIDAYDLWEAREFERNRWLEQLPRCCHCDEPIQQETAVCIDGAWYCDECLENSLRREVL